MITYRLMPDTPAVAGHPPKPFDAADIAGTTTAPWSRLTMIIGGPRSGSTWLAKIFDSHPDTLYRHEPDTVLRNPDLPLFVPRERAWSHAAPARRWVEQLLDTRSPKVAGSLPVFRKAYLPWPASLARQGGAYGLRLLERLPGRLGAAARGAALPDFVDWRSREDVHLVLKSVSARGRAAMLARALPGSRVVFILRHPCGSIGSELRGDAGGLFEKPWDATEMLHNPLAASYGLDAARLAAMPALEQRAWNWVLANEMALQSLALLPRLRIVRYQDLCEQPEETARALFGFAGLDWHPQTEAFLRRSTTHRGPARYYGVFRDTPAVVERWRSTMPQEAQRRIMAVVAQSSLAALFPEPGLCPASAQGVPGPCPRALRSTPALPDLMPL